MSFLADPPQTSDVFLLELQEHYLCLSRDQPRTGLLLRLSGSPAIFWKVGETRRRDRSHFPPNFSLCFPFPLCAARTITSHRCLVVEPFLRTVGKPRPKLSKSPLHSTPRVSSKNRIKMKLVDLKLWKNQADPISWAPIKLQEMVRGIQPYIYTKYCTSTSPLGFSHLL